LGQSTPQVSIIDNGQGNITVDVSDPSDPAYGIRGVWHYGSAWASKGQSGGNLYELYNKRTSLVTNLVSMTDWGTGSSKPIQPGIGGTGVTSIYASDVNQKPPDNQDVGFSDFIADNNESAVPTPGSPYTAYVDDNPASPDFGNAVLTFSYRVHNQSTNKEWYRIDKRWVIKPDSTINLSVTWTMLEDGAFSEPGTRLRWSRDGGWDRWLKYGADWTTPSYKYLLSTTNLANKYLAPGTGAGMDGRVVYESWDILNTFNPDWLALSGSANTPPVKITATPGYNLGPSGFSPTIEESVAQQIVRFYSGQLVTIGEHASAWMAWWGGNPPDGERYVALARDATWTDSFKIELPASNYALLDKTPTERYGPEITSVNVNDIDTTATVSWNTDVPATGVVELLIDNVWTVKGNISLLSTNHSFYLTGLQPGFPYAYRVKSTDVSGHESISFDTNFTKRITDGPRGGDCESVGKWNASTKTCTLTQDLVALTDNAIEITGDGITLDGNGHMVSGNGNGNGNGVYIKGRTGVTVKNLTIQNISYGIRLVSSSSNNIISNITNTDSGIYLDTYSNSNTIKNNSVTGAGFSAIALIDSSSNTIADNYASATYYTIMLYKGNSNILTGNNIDSHSYGIYLMGADNNTIIGNTINSELNIYSSDNNIVYHNNFLSGRVIANNSVGNIFNLQTPDGGNYFSNWITPDNNHDGFVDSPYVFSGGQDNLPWTTQNGWQQGKPSLTLNRPTTHWARYADYLMRKLSVTWTLTNNGSIDALDVIINSSIDTNGVSINMLASPLPFTVSSRISAYGGSASCTLVYDIPDGVGSWRSKLTGQAKDITRSVYSY
jgi:parallel beta-helix repeat protein